MKKALSVVLAMLMVFSMVGVMAFAEDDGPAEGFARYVFVNDDAEGTVIKQFDVAIDSTVKVTTLVPEEPVKAETEDTRYIFRCWICKNDGKEYYRSTIKNPTAADDKATFTFVADYSEEDIGARQSFWNFIESLFERINLLFEYFATIFEW